MGFISQLFGAQKGEDENLTSSAKISNIEEQNMSEVIEEENNIDTEVFIFSPYKELIDISKSMQNIIELNNMSQEIYNMAYNSNLTKEDVRNSTYKISQILKTTLENIQNLADPRNEILKIKNKCAVISNHTIIAKEVTYDNFLEDVDFDYLSDEIELLNTFKLYIPSIFSSYEFNLQNLNTDLISIDKSLKTISSSVVQLKESMKKIVEEITNYTYAINDARAKHKISVDWNGKKQPLMAYGQQLGVKREKFLEDEKKLNSDIKKLCKTYQKHHDEFRSHCQLFADEITKQSEIIVRENASKKNNIERIYNNIFNIKSKLEYFEMNFGN